MYAFNNSREKVPDYDFVSWPPRGPVPAEFFTNPSAWSVSFHPRKHNPPGKDVRRRCTPPTRRGTRPAAR